MQDDFASPHPFRRSSLPFGSRPQSSGRRASSGRVTLTLYGLDRYIVLWGEFRCGFLLGLFSLASPRVFVSHCYILASIYDYSLSHSIGFIQLIVETERPAKETTFAVLAAKRFQKN